MTPVSLRLGLRFARPRSYVAAARVVAVLLIAAMAVLSVLILSSAHFIVDRQQRVEDARSPHEPDRIDPVTAEELPKTATFTHDWNGRTLTRVVVSTARPSRITPPGVKRLPGPGEAFVSPAVLSSSGQGPIGWVVDGFKVVGVIGAEGLTSPDELRVVHGASPNQTRRSVMTVTDRFGARTRSLVSFDGALGFLLPLVLVMTFLPMGLALVLATRLLAPETDRRFRLLRAVGVRSRTCRLIAAAEMLPPAALGAVIGWAAYRSIWCRMSSVPGTDFSFWPGDARVPAVIEVAAPLLCVIGCLAVTATSIGVPTGDSTRPAQATRRVPWWWVVPTSLGVLVIAYASLQDAETNPDAKRDAILGAGVVLVGLPSSLQFLTQLSSRGLSAWARTAAGLVAARWIGDVNGATWRLATCLAVGLFAFGATAPLASSLKGDTSVGEEGLAAANGYNLYVSNTVVDPPEIEAIAEVRQALSVVTGKDARGTELTILFASCRELLRVVETSQCDGGPQWINTSGGRLDGYLPMLEPPISTPALAEGVRDLPKSEIRAPLGGEFQGALLIPSRELADTSTADRDYLVNLADGGVSLDRFETQLAKLAPTAYYGNTYADLIGQANAYLGYLQFLQIGVAAGMLGLLIALVAASLRSVLERRRSTSTLRVVGAPRRVRLRAHVASQAGTAVICCGLAAALCALFWFAIGRIDPLSAMDPPLYVWLAIAPLTMTVLLALVTAPAALGESDPVTAAHP